MSETLIRWGYLGLALCAFLAGTPLPMNSEVAMSLALVEGWPVAWVIASVVAGNWLGASVNYFLGRLCSYDTMIRWTHADPQRMERVRLFMTGKGTWLALGSGLPIVGNLVIITYGIMKVPFLRVGTVMLVGQIVRFTLWALFTIGIAGLF